jgi:predicted dehydrogenase
MKEITRREFVEKAAAAGIGLGAISAASGVAAPNNKVVVAVMGTNSRGASLARSFARNPGSEVAYICDVDERASAKSITSLKEVQARAVKEVKDFRRILDDKTVDALVIATPDHWHAPAAIAACAAGKHVYVEKPCSHNPREGELLVEAARKYRRVVQMGSQRRSWPRVIEAIEGIKAGSIGRVYYSRGWYANHRDSIGRGKVTQVPSWLDYNLWQGPAPRRSFKDNVIHYNWHWFWNWGTGESGNNGIHALDLCRWALGVDYPTRVTSTGGRFHFNDDWETPDTQVMTFDFEGGKQVTWEGLSSNAYGLDGTGFGVSVHGENGSVVIGGSNAYTLYDREGKKSKSVAARPDEQKIDLTGPAAGLDAVHITNFLEAIRNGKPPAAEILDGHKSTLMTQLGNISLRVGRSLRCEPKNGHIVGDKEAMALWSREYERGWEPKV